MCTGQRLLLFWILFNLFVLGMLALDLFVFEKPADELKFRQALILSLAWLGMAAGFAVLLYFWRGRDSALEFTAGYLVELSLSVDNLFVFLLVFRYFRVSTEVQHKVLFWGIVGALIMRGVFIVIGIELIQRFHWVIFAFGAFLIYSGIKLLREEEAGVQPEKNPLLRILRRWLPVTEQYEGAKFFVRRERLYATPLLVVLIVIETTDLLFATDSIPAVLAITLKAFIVYTSNVFAVLGLRSLFFVLAGMIEIFHYLHYGLAIVLMFIGAKMLVSDYYQISTELAIGVVAGVLSLSILASVLVPKRA